MSKLRDLLPGALKNSSFPPGILGNPTIVAYLSVTLVFEVVILLLSPSLTRANIGTLFTVYFGISAIVSGAFGYLQLAKVTDDVNRLVEEKIFPLYSFSEVLYRALRMIKDTHGEIYMSSFVCKFGVLHEGNSDIEREYSDIQDPEGASASFQAAVESFFDELKEKAFKLPKVRLILSKESDLREKILPGLKKVPGYGDIEVESVTSAELKARNTLLTVSSVSQAKSRDSFLVYEIATMPQQVLITKMVSREGFDYFATMIFLVGDDLLGRGEVCGYYSESNTIASVYLSYLEGYIESGTPLSPTRSESEE